MLKKVGFVHHQTSMKTEASYYRWPDRPQLIRVATHGGRQSRNAFPMARENVIAKITFRGTHVDPPGMMNISDEKVERVVALAIGQYFLKSSGTGKDAGDNGGLEAAALYHDEQAVRHRRITAANRKAGLQHDKGTLRHAEQWRYHEKSAAAIRATKKAQA